MTIIRPLAITIASLATLTACSGKAPDIAVDGVTAGGDVAAFMGTWALAGSIPSPWVTTGFTPEANPEIAAAPLVLAETSSSGPAALSCTAAAYTTVGQPASALFEGSLTDIDTDARSIGIEPVAKGIPTLTQACTTGDASVAWTYHLIDPNTLLLGFDNTIYQFARQP